MNCPRCGHPLTTISITDSDGQARYCEQCRFADVTSTVDSVSVQKETWAEAIDRFRQVSAHQPATTTDHTQETSTTTAGDDRHTTGSQIASDRSASGERRDTESSDGDGSAGGDASDTKS